MCDRQWRSAVARGLVLHFVLCAVAWTPGSTQSCPALDVVDVSTRCEAQRKAPASLPIWHSAIEAARTCGDAAGSAAVGSTTVRGVVVASVTAQIFANFSRTMAPALGMQIQADTLPFEKLLNRFTLKLPESAADPGRYDFWMMSAEAMGDASVKGSFLDLSGFVLDDKSIDASDIPATWRGAMSSTYEGTFSALPVVAYVNHLYYRKDIFAAYNMTVPNTWDDVLSRLNSLPTINRDLTQKGRPPMLGLCFGSSSSCGLYGQTFIFILSSLVQLNGPSHGTFFDPENLGALFTGPAGREALRILQALRRYSLPENASCTDSISYHVGGRCLMTMSWALAFKLGAHVAVNSPVRGKQGVTSLPGSAVVLDRTTNRLVACTKQLCPYAIIVREPRTNESVLVNKVTNLDSLSIAINAYSPLHVQDRPDPVEGPGMGQAARSTRRSTGQHEPASCLHLKVLAAQAPFPILAASYLLMTRFFSPSAHKALMLGPTTEVTPIRYSELNTVDWVKAGYEPEDTEAFLTEYRKTLSGNNVLYELRIPGATQYQNIIDTMCADYLFRNASFENISAQALIALAAVFTEHGGHKAVLDIYRRSIGFVLPTATSGSTDKGASAPIAAIVAPVVVGGVLVLVGVALWIGLRLRTQRRQRLALLEHRNAAPGVGESTTLFVSDIQ
ncbi:hypothetical protein TSOC_013698, partial [Tetrabaena socialis]